MRQVIGNCVWIQDIFWKMKIKKYLTLGMTIALSFGEHGKDYEYLRVC
jgi:hypothetical protein